MLRGEGAVEQEVGWKNTVLSEDSASVSQAWGWKLSFKTFSLQQPRWFPPSLQSLSFHQLRSVQSGLNSWCLDAGTFTIGNTKKIYIWTLLCSECVQRVLSTLVPPPSPPHGEASAAALQLTECFIWFNWKCSGLFSLSFPLCVC